jgi:hypothetical protein
MSTYDPDDCMTDEERDDFEQRYQLGKYKVVSPEDHESSDIKKAMKMQPSVVKRMGFKQFIIERLKHGSTVAEIFAEVEQNRALYKNYIAQGIDLPEGIIVDFDVLECGRSYETVRYWIKKINAKMGFNLTIGKRGAKFNQFAHDYVNSFYKSKSPKEIMQELNISKASFYRYLDDVKKVVDIIKQGDVE